MMVKHYKGMVTDLMGLRRERRWNVTEDLEGNFNGARKNLKMIIGDI